MGREEANKELDIVNWYSALIHDKWAVLPVPGPRPFARYKHAAMVVDEKLYIAGGSRNGRYLSDVQVLDLKNMLWSTLKLNRKLNEKIEGSSPPEDLPATSGHHMIKWGNKLLLVGGHSKESSNIVTVHFIDLETHDYGVIDTSGNIPVARAGHSVTLAGSRLIMFGGEDRNRGLLNDIHVLDLETMIWDMVETMQTPPAPRFDHTAAMHANRYFMIFCGCSHSIFFNDLHVLDFQTMEWSQPQILGDYVTPRAGHAGITIGENWYIVGGGDNKSGTTETLVLNTSKLVCSVIMSVEKRNPLASEGLSLCSASIGGEMYLVAFGGYNGRYSNEAFVMKPKLRDESYPKIFQSPAAAAAAASVTAAYAVAKPENLNLISAKDSVIKEPEPENNNSQLDLTNEISSIREENKDLESALTRARAEYSTLKGKIDETTSAHAELSKELHSVEGQLVAERSRCSKLETQIAELQKMLESLPSIEKEVQALRSQKSTLEENADPAGIQRQSSGGVFQYFYRSP